MVAYDTTRRCLNAERGGPGCDGICPQILVEWECSAREFSKSGHIFQRSKTSWDKMLW